MFLAYQKCKNSKEIVEAQMEFMKGEEEEEERDYEADLPSSDTDSDDYE